MLLQTQSITKEFGKLRAVNQVSLDIHKGDIHAIIGPNGAGKSTYFNLITGAPANPPILILLQDIIRRLSERFYLKIKRSPIFLPIPDAPLESLGLFRSPVSTPSSLFMKVYSWHCYLIEKSLSNSSRRQINSSKKRSGIYWRT